MGLKGYDFASASVEAPRRPMPRLLLISILFAHLPTVISSPTSCPYGFTGPDCAVKTCRLGCSGHGLCVDGVCYCDPFYAGDGCQTAVHDCSFRGIYNPVLAKCECDAGYIGAECHLLDPRCPTNGSVDKLGQPQVCSGRGFCVDGVCHCPPDADGLACEKQICPLGCSGNGKCSKGGRCVCDVGWGGPSCAVRHCAGLGSWTLTLCSGHGACLPNGTCACRPGWKGLDCATVMCPADASGKECSGHGLCRDDSKCYCNPNYGGPACELALCPRGNPILGKDHLTCSGKGVCVNGKCECQRGYGGEACEDGCTPGDSSTCSGHGSCDAIGVMQESFPLSFAPPAAPAPASGESPHHKCNCEEGYRGPTCAERMCSHLCYASEHQGRGRCGDDGYCECLPGWQGSGCEKLACEGGCGEEADPPRGECVSLLPPTNAELWTSRSKAVATHLITAVKSANGFDNKGRPTYASSIRDENGVSLKGHVLPKEPRKCLCTPGWFGPKCDQPFCPTPAKMFNLVGLPSVRLPASAKNVPCGGKGDCQKGGTCLCMPGYGGQACEKPACLNDCSQRGTCRHSSNGTTAFCECDMSYTGADCSKRACPNNCSGVGWCSSALDYQCVCPPGRSGPDCSSTCGASCAWPRGKCGADGKCHCANGWTGEYCERAVCPAACSGHGQCVYGGWPFSSTTTACKCDDGWLGPACSYQACPNGCSGKGECKEGKCVCELGYSGDDCSARCGRPTGNTTEVVVEECSGHGRCVVSTAEGLSVSAYGKSNGQCECSPGYVGSQCETKSCLMGCSGRGLCHDGKCVCAMGYAGEDCATSTAPNARDCSTGCVHLCASRCATAATATTSEAGQLRMSAALGGLCFGKCRKRCAAACHSHSAQRLLWADKRRIDRVGSGATADLERAAAASRTLGLQVPNAAVMPPYEGLPAVEILGNTMPDAGRGKAPKGGPGWGV